MTSSITRRILIAVLASLAAGPPALAQDAPARPATPAASAASDTVLVFAAASLKNALDAIGKEWTMSTGRKVAFSYAASGPLAKQIDSGAPADLFASADLAWMDYAAQKALIRPETRTELLGNKLVLIAPRDAAVDIKIMEGVKLAEAIGNSKLATGMPGSVPVGTYAKAALTALGVWESVASKIAGTESARAALAFVARGEAKLGIVYQTDANSEPKVKIVDTFPAHTHPPIVYPFALTARSKNPAAAEFLAYLRTPASAKTFQAQGFTMLR